jgi:diguanylate cyclase (GGDEF)-like protein
MWTVQTVLALGTVLICCCVYLAGLVSGLYSAMFVWVVLVAASFFSQRAVAAHVIWVLITWGLTLSVVAEPQGFSGLTRWILGSIVLTVSAFVMSEIVAGRSSAEERLRSEAEERERLQRELKRLAEHDPLTDLPNRRLFEREIAREFARARRQDTPLCLVVLDLNEFKQYNDLNGHVAGDKLLKGSAVAWVSVLRETDLIARLGGDEFVALLPDCPPEEAERVAQRLCSGVPLDDQSCSAGIACWDRRESAEELLTRVDKAMYESKERSAGHMVVAATPLRREAPTEALSG